MDTFAFKYRETYRLRDWHSFRYGGEFYEIEKISEEDFRWLGRDLLTAKQMLEIAQREFYEGSYREIWDE